MKWFTGLTVRKRIVLAFGLIIVIMSVITLAATRRIGTIPHMYTALIDRNASISNLREAWLNQNRIRTNGMQALLVRDRATVDSLVKTGDETIRKNKEILEQVLAGEKDPVRISKIRELDELRKAFTDTRREQVVPLLKEGETEKAGKLIMGIQAQRNDDMDRLLHDLETDFLKEAQKTADDESKAAGKSVIAFGATGMLFVLIAVLVGFSADRIIVSRETAEKERISELDRNRAYTRSLIEASLDPLVTISKEGKIMDVNEGTVLVTGVPRDRLIGSDFSSYFTEPERAKQGYQTVLSEGSVKDYPLAIRHASGAVTDVVYNASIFKNEEGEVQGVFAAARDITDRKKLEQELRARIVEMDRNRAYTRSLIEASLDPLVTISKEGKIMDVNEGTVLVTGVSRDRLIGSDFSSYFTEPERAKQGYRTVLSEGSVKDYPLAIRHASGAVTDVVYNASVFKNEEGEVQGVFAAARDITDRKKLEQELRKAYDELEIRIQERTASLTKIIQEAGETTGVLASSTNTILAALTQLASSSTQTATSVSETTTTVEEVKQIASLSSQKAKDISDSAKKSAEGLQEGKKNTDESITAMDRIKEQMESIIETIMRLSEKSAAIGEITGTVNDIADQSHLLAVNASIEAAKAGEYGKGFSVVAQEIKSLADQSKQATAQVRAILTEVQKAISGAVSATEQASKVVDKGVKQSNLAGESIAMAVEMAKNVTQASTQIVVSSQQQLLGVEQVAMAMESINKASSQNVASTRDVENVAQNLHKLGQKLKELVETYTL